MENRRPRTVRRFDDGVDMWEMIDAPPAAMLAGSVERYTSYSERTASFTARRELAATQGALLFNLSDPLELVGADGAVIRLQAGEGFAAGVADATSISRSGGAQAGVHAFLPLSSLSAAIGMPVAEIANRVVPLTDLLAGKARELGQRLLDARDHDDRFDLLDDFLARQFDAARAHDRPIFWALDRLDGTDAPAIDALARNIGWSRKHFAARFKAVTGFTPDTYRRLARFERFSRAIAASPETGLAMLAVDAGYHDQPHMTRDVRSFSAMTPAELRARLIPGQAGVRDE